jgi:ABC-type antimicrobial peptide transport system permease subunit
MVRQVHLLNSIDPGYPADEILTMRMGLFPGDYPTDADRAAFFGDLLQVVAAIPGVKSAAVTDWLGQFGSPRSGVAIASNSAAKPEFTNQTFVEMVSPEHFDVFSLAPIAGSLFTDATSAREPVVVVNESFVRQFLGGNDPLNESILLTSFSSDDADANQPLRIIGVVPDVRMSNFVVPDASEPIVYVPFLLQPPLFMTLTVRSIAIDQPSLVASVQQSILNLDPHLPTYFVQSMREFSDKQRDPLRVSASFFLLIGILALFLAAIGVYGMVAFDVNRQRRDLGVRMALGATTRQVINHVLRRGCIQVVLGILIGTLLAAIIGQLARQFLIGSQPLQPAVYLGAVLVLIATAILAFFLPARRAARLSPLEALRHD